MAKHNKILSRYTNALNKKGVLKGRNKKETRALKGGCPHHRINKHGKVKSSIIIKDGTTCVCTMCGAEFPAVFYNNNSINDIVDNMIELNNHNKFIAVAANAGDEMIELFSQTGVILQSYKKASKKNRNLAEKQDNVKKKNNKHNNRNGSSALGSWNQK